MSSLSLIRLQYSLLQLRKPVRKQQRALIINFKREKSSLTYNRKTGVICNDKHNKQPISRTLIGLEIHAQLTSTSRKLFSPSSTNVSTKNNSNPNTNICHFDIAYPGALPQLSGAAVHSAILTACALNCTINETSRFERKHYIYPDLPHGYQITQQRWPFATSGMLLVNEDITVPMERIQLEMDSGKTIVLDDNHDENGKGRLLLDYNRAGVPLLELVFQPTLHSSYEVAESIQFLRRLLRRLDVCDGKMEEGSLRADVNVSITPFNSNNDCSFDNNDNTGRVEIKNLNSIRQVIMAIEYEGLRQTDLLLSSTIIKKETRTFDPIQKRTSILRTKEDDVDYRFMPEPNLPPLKLNPKTLKGRTLQEVIDSFQSKLNNANEHKIIKKLTSNDTYNLSKEVSIQLAASDFIFATSLFYETMNILIKEIDDNDNNNSTHDSSNRCENNIYKYQQIASLVANWICNDYFALLKKQQQERSNSSSSNDGNDDNLSHIDSNRFAMLLLLVWKKELTIHNGKIILSIMHDDLVENKNDTDHSRKNPRDIADELGVMALSSSSGDDESSGEVARQRLVQIVKDIVWDQQYEKQRMQFQKGGKHVNKMHKFFFGQIMRNTKGVWEPSLIHDVLKDVLQELSL